MSKSSISTNQELRKGDYLLSNNGNYKAILQEDGNFVLLKWTPLWASNSKSDKSCRVILQADANLVMYGKDDTPIWSTETAKKAVLDRMRLTVTDDGKLQLTNNSNVLWENGKIV